MRLYCALPKPRRWGYLKRHISFGQVTDLDDIINLDWPEVSEDLPNSLFTEDDPLEVEAEDLGELVASKPAGAVPTQIDWERLDEDQFERLIFSLLKGEPRYENVQRLTHPNAPDRGRDLTADRIIRDSLSGVKREKVMIQCKHWLSKSVGIADVATLKEQAALWNTPRVDVLIIVTSGHFSTDAVDRIERQNAGKSALKIEMWPGSHLESLLSERPMLIAQFELR